MVLLAQEATAGLGRAAAAEQGRASSLSQVSQSAIGSLADISLHGRWVQGRKETGSFHGVVSALLCLRRCPPLTDGLCLTPPDPVTLFPSVLGP